MEQVKITFLGTANAVPTEKRNHTAILVEKADERILIDCGEGTQRQFKFSGNNPVKLTRLLITHWHGDHVLGIPGLFQTLAMSGYNKTLRIHGPPNTAHNIQLMERIFKDFKIIAEVKENSGIVFENSNFKIEALPMNHGTPTYAYSITYKDKRRLKKSKLKEYNLPNSPILKELQEGKDIVWNGKKIKSKDISYLEKGRKVAVILDTAFNENAVKIALNSDILIAEATFAKEEKQKAAEYKHLTAWDAAKIAKKAKVKKLILTHLSQRYEHNPSIIEKEARKIFKNTKLVKDLDVISL